MLLGELWQILLQWGIAYLFFYLFVLVGQTLLSVVSIEANTGKSSSYSALFSWFLTGLLLTITCYAIVVTQGVSVTVFLLPLGYLFYRHVCSRAPSIQIVTLVKKPTFHLLETAAMVLIIVGLLHLFPVSEYKQADSLFYLKIAESLNLSGQENVSQYYNSYNASFHGAEPYHYVELWITAFIIRFTQSWLPSIYVERFITQGILLTGLIIGLYHLAATVLRSKMSLFCKIFCWSLLFIFPNLLGFFPKLYSIFISDFEGNVLDRPNFRIIYLLLAAVFLEVYNGRKLTNAALYLCLMLCVVSFQCAVVFVPGLLLYGLVLLLLNNRNHRSIWVPTIAFTLALGIFYWWFSPLAIPSFLTGGSQHLLWQTLQSIWFIGFSIVTSFVYTLLLVVLFALPILLLGVKAVVAVAKKWWLAYLPFACIGITGLVLARVFFLKDNAYQFLFITHILATLLIWLMYLWYLKKNITPRIVLLVSGYLSLLWLVNRIITLPAQTNIYKQNGHFVYNGLPYSKQYISQVMQYFQNEKPALGGYIADSSFYNQLYYSRRNPNVYFMPVSYLVAGRYNQTLQICLSDTAAILHQLTNPVFINYLNNAIERSLFYRFRLQNKGLLYQQQVAAFTQSNQLSYIIVSKNVWATGVDIRPKRQLTDPITGEQFLILR